ncbi:MAG: hypothetical protein LBM66_03895, partial [Bifidobacteriaceae bacterium]|nr:hypothetical protein [Bifidobacteriaceae bacterium]
TSTAPAVTVTATGVPVAGWATDEAGAAAGPAAASPSATTHLLDDKVGAPAGVAKKRTGGQWLQLPDGTGLTLQSQSKNSGDYPWQRFADPSRAITALVQAVPLADTNEAMQQQITDTARNFQPGTFFFQADTEVSGRYAEPVSVYSFVSGGHTPGTWGSAASSAALEHWGVYVEALKCGFIVDFAMGEGQGEKDLADVEGWLQHLRLVKP